MDIDGHMASGLDSIMGICFAYRRSQVLFTLVEFNVFDLLNLRGPLSIDEISTEIGSDRDSTERLMNAAVSMGLFNLCSDNLYENSSISEQYLTTASRQSMVGIVHHNMTVSAKLFGHLSETLQTGDPPLQSAFGVSTTADVFSKVYATKEAKERFFGCMQSYSAPNVGPAVRAFDLSDFHHVIDFGGGPGMMAVAACRLYQNLRATVLELPQVVDNSRALISKETDVADRIHCLAGDMFNFDALDLPKDFDLALVSQVLHGSFVEKCKVLLSGIYQRLPSGGGILIVEMLLNDEHKSKTPTNLLLMDLSMMLHSRGKERTASEYKQLLEDAGFVDVQSQHTGQRLGTILARKR